MGRYSEIKLEITGSSEAWVGVVDVEGEMEDEAVEVYAGRTLGSDWKKPAVSDEGEGVVMLGAQQHKSLSD